MFRFKEKVDFKEYTLIIPSISIGNVGQLTVDLLISTYNMKLVGTIWDKAIIPGIGINPFDPESDTICVPCEFYMSNDHKLVVLQIRTSIEQKFAHEFFDKMRTFIVDEKFKQVVILASAPAFEQHAIKSGPYRYVSHSQLKKHCEENKIIPIEVPEQEELIITGSGMAAMLYNKLHRTVDTSVLLKYTSEGDNRPDAISMFHLINKVMSIDTTAVNVKHPYSWNMVFGGPPPVGLY